MEEKKAKATKKVHQGRNLARFRRLRDWTQQQLAEILVYDRMTINGWEQEEVLKDDIIKKCAKALGIDPYYIECASEEEVFGKFTGNTIGVVAEDGSKLGAVAEDVGVVAEEGATVEYNENPLGSLIEAHDKQMNFFISQIEFLNNRISQLSEQLLENEKQKVRELQEEVKNLKK